MGGGRRDFSEVILCFKSRQESFLRVLIKGMMGNLITKNVHTNPLSTETMMNFSETMMNFSELLLQHFPTKIDDIPQKYKSAKRILTGACILVPLIQIIWEDTHSFSPSKYPP